MGTARLGQFVHGEQVSRKTLCLFLYCFVNNVLCENLNLHSHQAMIRVQTWQIFVVFHNVASGEVSG